MMYILIKWECHKLLVIHLSKIVEAKYIDAAEYCIREDSGTVLGQMFILLILNEGKRYMYM